MCFRTKAWTSTVDLEFIDWLESEYCTSGSSCDNTAYYNALFSHNFYFTTTASLSLDALT